MIKISGLLKTNTIIILESYLFNPYYTNCYDWARQWSCILWQICKSIM